MTERVVVLPGKAVPWEEKSVNRKTGTKFINKRQSQAISRYEELIGRLRLEPFEAKQPVLVSCVFHVKRPDYHFGTGRNADKIKPEHLHVRPTGRPDLSNCLKLVEDAMVLAGLLPDDDQIVGYYLPFGKAFVSCRGEDEVRTVARVKPLPYLPPAPKGQITDDQAKRPVDRRQADPAPGGPRERGDEGPVEHPAGGDHPPAPAAAADGEGAGPVSRHAMQRQVVKLLEEASPGGVSETQIGNQLVGKSPADPAAVARSILQPLESAGMVRHNGDVWYRTVVS